MLKKILMHSAGILGGILTALVVRLDRKPEMYFPILVVAAFVFLSDIGND